MVRRRGQNQPENSCLLSKCILLEVVIVNEATHIWLFPHSRYLLGASAHPVSEPLTSPFQHGAWQCGSPHWKSRRCLISAQFQGRRFSAGFMGCLRRYRLPWLERWKACSHTAALTCNK